MSMQWNISKKYIEETWKHYQVKKAYRKGHGLYDFIYMKCLE